MADSPIFRQENELRDWLTDQPQVTHRKLAMLGALRILPLALEKPEGAGDASAVFWAEADTQENDQRCLAIFRAAITGITAAWDRNQLLDHAAKDARENLRTLEKTKSAVLRTTSQAASIFKFAASVNSPDILSRDRSANFAAFSLWQGWTLLRDVSTATEREEWQTDPELEWDIAHKLKLLDRPDLRLFNSSSQPAQSTHTWAKFCAETRPQPSPWQFWRSWYQGILDGTPINWDLQLQVALIEDSIWNAGPQAVAEEIQRIQTEFLSTKLPQTETLSREDDSLNVVRSVVADPDQMIDRIFAQLDFSLALALRGHNSSGFSEMCVAYAYLDHTRKNCRDDPNAVHMHLRLAREVIEGKLAAQEYHREDALIALVSALGQHEIQLRADHPMIRQKHYTFVAQRLRELDDEKRIQIAAEFRALEPDTKGRLRTEFGLDATTLATDTGIEAQRDALKRAGGRSQKMNLIERAANATKSADGSALNKGTGLIMRLQKIAELLSPLL